MSTIECQVAVLGGGPAGAATAITLNRHAPHLDVVLVAGDRDKQPRMGETLPPQAREFLSQLGLWSAFRREGHHPCHGFQAAWGTAELVDQPFVFAARGTGWHLDRARFDDFLANAANTCGTRLLHGSRTIGPVDGETGDWLLPLIGHPEVTRLRAEFVVDACGRTAWFARRQGAGLRVEDRLLGWYTHFRTELTETYTTVEAVPNGWWYSSVMPGGGMVVALMTDRDSFRSWRPSDWWDALAQTRHTRTRLTRAGPLGPPRRRPAFSQRLDPVTGPGWLATGDAAMAVDPLSSQGICRALSSGIFAGYAVADHLAGKPLAMRRYRYLIKETFHHYLATRAKYYRMERRWPGERFWQRRHDCSSVESRPIGWESLISS
ncbi:Tryptophan 7-halogenase [Sulfidibacter corallicola]|uniref:Tryptophan 7-halogenase n=1 Tax=Sulfidibacter corallicola TaxID=2818388 RepID=A0A8A4TYT2_SULCO|nr:tryptophan 7-halogenase [Sulfidibacter corallicola]QTD54254.1 tryptophan 7-halogenase [Sulfidibacter corallicola]